MVPDRLQMLYKCQRWVWNELGWRNKQRAALMETD